jgi:hypothetical protein
MRLNRQNNSQYSGSTPDHFETLGLREETVADSHLFVMGSGRESAPFVDRFHIDISRINMDGLGKTD